jgi:hypothetical protein
MEITRHALFPVLVGEAFNENHEDMKQQLENAAMNHLDENGLSNERTGHVDLHLDPAFNGLMKFVTLAAKEYIATHMFHPDTFDFNIVKTWMNIIKDEGNPRHAHADAHLSFCYYINVPDDANTGITFHNYTDRIEPFPGCILHNNPQEWNVFNSYAWSFPVKEGQLLIFPSRLQHHVEGSGDQPKIGVQSIEELSAKRVSLAGDIVLTYKEKAAKHLGLQPIQNWRVFTTDPLQ